MAAHCNSSYPESKMFFQVYFQVIEVRQRSITVRDHSLNLNIFCSTELIDFDIAPNFNVEMNTTV
jgi:hypothetical protein